MSERLEEHLGDALARRAHTIAGTRITSDGIVGAGRAAHRRQRVAVVSTVAASVAAVLVVVVATITATSRPERSGPPGDQRSPSPTQSTSVPAGVTPAQLGLDVLSGNTVVRPDGSRVTLPFADGVADVARAKAGWMVSVTAADGQSLWYLPDTGQPARIGRIGGNFRLSKDGTLLVATGIEGASNVDAYRLPSLQRFRHTTFDSGMGPLFAGIAGERVLLNGAQGSPGPSGAAVWNLRSGALRRTPVDVWILGVSGDGRVLRRVDRYAAGSKVQLNACVDVVAMSDTLPTGETGYCDPRWLDEARGRLSPNGDWAVLFLPGDSVSGPPILIRSADLHGDGRLIAVPMELPGRTLPQFWDTDQSYIAESITAEGQYVRCTTSGRCTPVVPLPDLPLQRMLPPTSY